MSFTLPEYRKPDFTVEIFRAAPDAALAPAAADGFAPENFHATTIFPEYIKTGGDWLILRNSRMDCAVVMKKGRPETLEIRKLKRGDKVVLGRSEDGSEGILVHADCFDTGNPLSDKFVFRTGRTRETSYSRDYDTLYELLKYERENGSIVWVLGPAVSFDSDSRNAMSSLISHGYAHAVLAGNALATHDIEASLFGTALGQDIYSQEPAPRGHYHHLDVINSVCAAGSIESLIRDGSVTDGIVKSCVDCKVPLVLCGSIRDDGPLPEVIADVRASQDAMRGHTSRATTLIGLATQLHVIAAGNMTPAYQAVGDTVRPVYIFAVDVSEFAVNKLRDRGSLAVKSIVTNVQDFLANLARTLI